MHRLSNWPSFSSTTIEPESLDFRLDMENLYIAKAQQRFILGWGTWSRGDVYDRDLNYRKATVLDGRWIGALGSCGLVGLTAMTTALLLPTALLLRRFPVQQWDHPSMVSATGFALILNLFVIDGLINGMLNLLYTIAAGGLVNVVGAHGRQSIMTAGGPKTKLMAQYRDVGRAMKNQGRFAEAKTAWLRALDVRNNESAARPGVAALEQPWCNCANDLAWLLVTSPDLAVRDPLLALSLASKAIAAHPECATYWNTLGAASTVPATTRPRSPPSITRARSATGAQPSTISFSPWLTRDSATKNKPGTTTTRRCSGWNNMPLVTPNYFVSAQKPGPSSPPWSLNLTPLAR